MNYRIKSIVFAISTLLFFSSHAQEKYEVFYLKGSASLMDNGSSIEVKRGMKFSSGTLHLQENSMLVIMNPEGRNLRISDGGEYGAKDISKLYNKTKGDITSDYFKYVWEEMKNTDEESTIAKVKGSVYRGDVLMFFPPDGCIFTEYALNFVWKGGNEKSYFRILDEDNLMLNIATRDSSLDVFIDSDFFETGKYYRWEVGSTNPPPQNYPPFEFKIASSDEMDEFESGIEELRDQLDYPKDMECIILAGYCAQNKYYMNAIAYFEMAKYYTEDAQMVEQAYAAFLESVMRTE